MADSTSIASQEMTLIAERLAVNDVEVAERLRRLGYEAWPIIDTILTDGDGIGRPRPPGSQRVRCSVSQGSSDSMSPRSRPLDDLGFDTADVVASLDLMSLDAEEGKQLWEVRRGRIRREWISEVADQLGMSADEATRQLRVERFVVLDALPDPHLDAAIVGEIGEELIPGERVVFLDQSRPVDRRAIVGFAVRAGQRMDRVAADLRALGFIVPPVGDLGLVDGELARMCADSSRTSIHLWPFNDRTVMAGAIVDIADKDLGRSADYVAERLRSVGYKVPDIASLTDEDRLLISVSLSGHPSWLDHRRPASVLHLARAAIKLEKDPHVLARRLLELGYAFRRAGASRVLPVRKRALGRLRPRATARQPRPPARDRRPPPTAPPHGGAGRSTRAST